jgi:putative Mg2+ transporter-C (MgtC) family protein
MGRIIHIVNYVEDFNTVSIVLRLVLATIFGGIIGIEREARRHSAGFRTFTLVCIGSALCTIVNIYLFNITGNTDVARLPAGVVNGIGFLGAGSIVVTGIKNVRGLTTAAGLWATAAIGIALGSGMILVSSLSFILIMGTISIMRRLSDYVVSKSSVFSVYIEFLAEDDFDRFLQFIKDNNIRIVTIERRKELISKKCDVGITAELDLRKRRSHAEILRELANIEGLHYCEEVGR